MPVLRYRSAREPDCPNSSTPGVDLDRGVGIAQGGGEKAEADFWYLGCIDSTLWWLIALAFLDTGARPLRKRCAAQIDKAIHWLLAQEHQRTVPFLAGLSIPGTQRVDLAKHFRIEAEIRRKRLGGQ